MVSLFSPSRVSAYTYGSVALGITVALVQAKNFDDFFGAMIAKAYQELDTPPSSISSKAVTPTFPFPLPDFDPEDFFFLFP